MLLWSQNGLRAPYKRVMTTGPITTEEVDAAIRNVTLNGQKVRLRTGEEFTQATLGELRALRSVAAQREAQGACTAPVISQPLTFNNDL